MYEQETERLSVNAAGKKEIKNKSVSYLLSSDIPETLQYKALGFFP